MVAINGNPQASYRLCRTLTDAQVLASYATDLGDAVRFDFGAGQVVTLFGVSTLAELDGVTVTLRPGGAPAPERLPTITHVCVSGVDSEALLFLLDDAAVAASAASSCASGATESSHVLAAMGLAPEVARGSLRLSLGWTSTDADVDRVLEVLPAAIAANGRDLGLICPKASGPEAAWAGEETEKARPSVAITTPAVRMTVFIICVGLTP